MGCEVNEIARQRLVNVGLTGKARRSPADVVQWLGAVQAQEFVPANWALALRLREGVMLADTLRAHDSGAILRTHVLRPTWHFVAAADARWMLELSAPNIHRSNGPYQRRFGMDRAFMRRAAKVAERGLRDGAFLTRQELRAAMSRDGLDVDTWRLGFALMWLEAERVIISGPRRGAHHTYAAFDLRAPAAKSRDRDESLGVLATRYFRSHGPATIQDFMWWSYLKAEDARRAAEIAGVKRCGVRDATRGGDARAYLVKGRGECEARPARVLLLPIYDEYTVAYRHRDAVPYGGMLVKPAKGGFARMQHALIVDGQVAGMWRIAPGKAGPRVAVQPFRKLTAVQERATLKEARRLERFLAR